MPIAVILILGFPYFVVLLAITLVCFIGWLIIDICKGDFFGERKKYLNFRSSYRVAGMWSCAKSPHSDYFEYDPPELEIQYEWGKYQNGLAPWPDTTKYRLPPYPRDSETFQFALLQKKIANGSSTVKDVSALDPAEVQRKWSRYLANRIPWPGTLEYYGSKDRGYSRSKHYTKQT